MLNGDLASALFFKEEVGWTEAQEVIWSIGCPESSSAIPDRCLFNLLIPRDDGRSQTVVSGAFRSLPLPNSPDVQH